MTALADVVRNALPELICECWDTELMEAVGETDCLRCRLRAALRDDERASE